jgi:hypothetical protein
MTYNAPLFGTQQLLGVDASPSGYDQPYTVSTASPEYPAQPIGIGTVTNLSQGGTALYVTTATATSVNQGDFVYVNTSMYAAGLTSVIAATAGQGAILGVSMATLTTGQYGWVQTSGNVPYGVNVVSGVAAYTTLHTSATAGRLTGTAVTGTSYPIVGITTVTTSAGTAGIYAGIINGSSAINTATTLG